MGGGTWTRDAFKSYTVTASVSKGIDCSFDALTDSVVTNASAQQMFTQRTIAPELNPRGVMRECLDTTEHPETIPVILALDVTGSMGSAATEIAKKLNVIMTNLYDKVKDVEFLIMGIGDLAYDSAPIQASQFESDVRIAEQLDKIYFEGRGGGNSYESYTAAWYFNKLITLLTSVNPNTIEMLGCKPEHYLYLTPIGEELINHRHIFLSKKCIYSFGGYANQQLRRLDNKAARLVDQTAQEHHILRSIENASVTFTEKYAAYPEDHLRLYIDKSEREDLDSEIYMDVNLTRYPLRDYKSMWSEMNNIVKDYSKICKRNSHAIEHGKLAKHMMHLVRLYLMCFDILERGEIITYREKDHDLLMDIRNGKYLDDDRQPTKEFMQMVDYYETKLEELKNTTELPEQPDYKKINRFVMSINELVVLESRCARAFLDDRPIGGFHDD